MKLTLFGMMKIVIRICFGIPKVNVLDYSIGSMLAERATRSVASFFNLTTTIVLPIRHKQI